MILKTCTYENEIKVNYISNCKRSGTRNMLFVRVIYIPIEDGSGTQGITVNIHYVICSFLSPAKENGKIFID